MDIQTKKILFVQEFLRLKDENLIDKLIEFLRLEKKKETDKKLKQYSHKEFNDLIDRAESDSENEKLTTAEDLKNEVKSWN